jgi:hypothetical protein
LVVILKGFAIMFYFLTMIRIATIARIPIPPPIAQGNQVGRDCWDCVKALTPPSAALALGPPVLAELTAVAGLIGLASCEYQSPLAPGLEKLKTVPAAWFCGMDVDSAMLAEIGIV